MDDADLIAELRGSKTLDAEILIRRVWGNNKWAEIVAGLQEPKKGIHEHPFPHVFSNLVPFLDNARQHIGHKRPPGSLNLALCIEKVLYILAIILSDDSSLCMT
jgi:hypothetical protein